MSPLYDYRCRACGHVTERLRRYDERDLPLACEHCFGPSPNMERLPPLTHVEPDGIYSYEPNIGTQEAFERKNAKIREREEKG